MTDGDTPLEMRLSTISSIVACCAAAASTSASGNPISCSGDGEWW